MQMQTTRFGSVEIQAEDILLFPKGLIGFEEERHWVLLADCDNRSVGWLQSLGKPELAVAVVSPRRFAPEYQVRVSKAQLAPLEIGESDNAYVLAVVSQQDDELTLNLRAPIVINLDRRLGRQLVTNDEQPLHALLKPTAVPLRKSA